MVFSNFHRSLRLSSSRSDQSNSGIISIENHLLPPKKRYRFFNPEDHTTITGKSTLGKRTRTEFAVPKDVVFGSASRTINSWKKLHEINLLKNIIEYHNQFGKYPFDDSKHMQNFYKSWIKRIDYIDEDVFTSKMVELPERFFRDQDKMFVLGPNIKAWMPPIDVKIYELSHIIWGQNDDEDEFEDDHDEAGVIDPKD